MGVRSPLLKSYGDDFAWSLLDATPDATVIVAGSGEIVFVNDHAGDLFGFGLEDLLGRLVDDLLPEALRAVHRAHRTRFRAEPTVRAMGAGLELWARRSDGSEFPVEISLSPLHLDDDVFAVAAVRDVTERVAAEDQLHRVLRTLDATDDGVFIFDAVTLRFSFVNEGAVRLVGYQRDELSSMTPLHINPYTTGSEYRRLVDDLFADGSSSMVRRSILLAKDGSEVPVEKSFHSATSSGDGRRWVITLARDITDRLAAEAELRQSQDARRQAERVLAVAEDRERIARDLHDTVIQRLFAEGLSLQAALSGVGDPQRTRSRLESTIDGLDQTIKELRMAVFSLQGAASAPGGLRGRLLQVVTDATDGIGFEPRLQFDGTIETMDVHIADNLVPVLREALSNIAHHAEAGQVRVAVSVADDVTLTVSDDGVGVPAEVATDAAALTTVVDELGDRRLDAYVQLPVTIGSAATTAIGRIRDLLTQGLIARFDAAAAVIGAMADGGNVILVAGNTPGHREHNDDQRARHALLRVLSHSILADSAGRSIRSTVLPGESTPAQIVATLEGHAASREQVIGEFVERDSDLSYADWRVELLSLVAHES